MTQKLEDSAGFRLAVLVEGGLGVIAVVLAWLLGIDLREMLPATWDDGGRAVARGVVATLPLLVGFWWLVRSPWAPLARLRDTVCQLVAELFPRRSIPQLLLISLLAGISEEILFRGVLQSLVERWSTPLIGLVVASLVFGALHALSWLYFVLAMAVGAYLGGILLRFDDLAAPMIAHALYDFVALIYLTRKRSPE